MSRSTVISRHFSTARTASRRRRWLAALVAAVTTVSTAGTALLASPAHAASVTSAAFSGGAGTFTAVNGTVYAKQGGALSLTVNTDANTQCVDVIDGTGTTIATQTSNSNKSQWVFSGSAYPWLTAGSGNGVVTYTTKAWKNFNGSGKCVANGGETFGIQSAAYTLDNTAPTATGALSPAPNGAGWNKSDVTVTWTGADAGGSGVKTVSPSADTVTTDGTVTKSTTVTDNVGNTGTGSVVVKLDKTAPTIIGSRTPAANANGWNNTDVTVSFTPGDATSGVKSSSAPTTLTTSLANQSVTGSVTDNADNAASTTVGGINIDKVAPGLSGAPTTSPNAAGWYRGDVTVHWTATDALSGTTSPVDTIISGEGNGLTSSASATDRAGNTSGSVQSAPAVKIDRTAPTTTVTAPPAWNNTDVTLTLVPHDNLSGVDTTVYQLDGGGQTSGTSVPVTAEGNHTLKFWSTDAAGNTEAAQTVSFGIDKTSPTIGHTQSPAANPDGWNNTDVTVTFTCADALSGVAACTHPQTIGSEGKAQPVTGTVSDNAGNTASDPATVSIDKTKPTITVDALPTPNGYGWYGDDVTATYTASDTLSGIKSQDHAHTFGEGADQTDTATATDAAGNSDSVSTSVVSVDKTAPVITGAVVETPNANGWFSGDVTVHWTCSDNLSGVVSCPTDSVVTGEGSDRTVSATVKDKAGHSSTATVSGIQIDRTAPGTTVTGVPAGWVNSPVTLGLQASDGLSGIDSTYFKVDGAATATKGSSVTIGEQGVHTVTYWSVDNAGNKEDAQSATVEIDLSTPGITASQAPGKNAHGWNNTDVAVSFACEDQTGLSGLESCSDPRTITTEGEAQSVTGTARDNAGNSTNATATVNIDKTAPTITGAPDRAANAFGWYRGDVTVSFTGKDTLSGIDTVSGPAHLGEGADQSVQGSAVDAAGNTASTSVGGINIDETPPTLSAAPTSSPNAKGWYNTDVTQVWAADDALSGLAGTKPGDSVLSTEGKGQTASTSVTDKAGNTTSAISAPVDIDKTAPNTDVSAPSGWVSSSVDVVLTPHDTLSGVDATYYTVDGGQPQTGTTVTLTTEGTHHIDYYSVDNAGNREQTRTASVQIDKTAPTIGHALDPAANHNGWNNSNVTVTFTCADQAGLSGVQSCTDPQTVSDEGRDQKVTGTATDNAGNTTTDPVTVSLDKTAPTLTASRKPLANSFGWNNTDVTVHFAADDALSGIATVTSDQTLGEGTNQSVDGTAVDAAGNSTSTSLHGINIDETAPTLKGEATTSPNANGWYHGDVTIGWTAGDDRSGVASAPEDTTITAEGSHLIDTATALDRAGNSTTADSEAVKIDRHAPTTGANAPSGWNNTAVTVSLVAGDNLSGVDATYYTVDDGDQHHGTTLTIDTEGEHTLTYWSVDEAGNTEAPHTVKVKIDLTKPTIGHTLSPAPNKAGWNNTQVTVSYQCHDVLSGVATCPEDTTVTTDGADQAALGTAVDNAGNTRDDLATVSIDRVKPTIIGTPDRAANSNGWYAGDVTVSYTCHDALSGVADCTSPDTIGEGKAQSATGTATDVAGNSDHATVGPINVDKTAPTLSGSPTTGPNGNGWYHGDVTVKWTAGDALSGLDGSAPADSTITSEGTSQTASASVQDLAGNQKSATSTPVKIDRTAPTTTVSDVSDWSNSSVTVHLTPSDNLSGVVATHYQLDSDPAATGESVTIDTEGVHTLQVWSVDAAGNVEAHKNIEVKIDKTAPAIEHSQSPVANARGWNKSDVTVTFSCTDTGSGIASCPAPRTVTTEGQNQAVDGTAVDHAGNTATDPATVSIDKTKPTVAGSLSLSANANGWFRSDVTATFDCADQVGLSGIVTCPAAKTLGEGADQSAGGTATDAAGNDSDPFTIGGINVDETKPTLDGAPTTSPNGNGWYNHDVVVRWNAHDALSGLPGGLVPADSTVTGEGDELSVGAAVSDKAGNTKSASVGGIRIDRTAPATGATAPSGWQRSDVTVTLAATDNLSGVAGTHYNVDGGPTQDGTSVSVSSEGTHTVAYWSVDNAGNVEPTSTVTVLVDKSAPTITGKATSNPNASGWYNAPVTVQFSCADAVSGISSCQPDATVGSQGPHSVTGNAVDNAGNTGSTTVGGLNVDTVAPSVAIGGIADGATYTVGAVPAMTVSATDATSGVVGSPTITKTGGLANGVGTFVVTGKATDRAGNLGSTTVQYHVVYGYGTSLFLQPVNDTAHQTGLATSVFNAGQTIPMKLQLRNAAGQVIQTNSAPQWFNPVKGSAAAAAVNESAYTAPETVGSAYAWDGTQYQYNWKTDKAQAGSYWRVGVGLDDGQTYFVNIALR